MMNAGQILRARCRIAIGYFHIDFDFYRRNTKAKKNPPKKKKTSTDSNPPSMIRKNGSEIISLIPKVLTDVEALMRYV